MVGLSFYHVKKNIIEFQKLKNKWKSNGLYISIFIKCVLDVYLSSRTKSMVFTDCSHNKYDYCTTNTFPETKTDKVIRGRGSNIHIIGSGIILY